MNMNTQSTIEQAHDWWNTLALGVAALVAAVLLMALTSCSTPSTNSANTNRGASTNGSIPGATRPPKTMESVPKSLADAGEFGENVYDYAKANDWKKADAKVASLKDAATRVRAEIQDQSARVDGLDANVAAVERAVTAKDRQAAMREANHVTFSVAEMTTAYKLTVPVEVTNLDYYGRELEIWAASNDASKLQTTATQMKNTWDALRPSIESHNAAEAKKFGSLVTQLDAAKTASDYARLAKPILDEVDNLEKVFLK